MSLKSIKSAFQRPYLFWVVSIFIAYLTLNVYLSEFYITLQYVSVYANQIHWIELGLSVLFTLSIALLVSINIVYGYIRHKEQKDVRKTGAVTCVATVGGLATGVCASCMASVFPLVIGLFGVTFSWARLPFGGMEIQLLTVGLLIASLYFLQRTK